MTRRTVAFVALLIALPGCFGTETGNPPAALLARSSDPGVALTDGEGVIVVEEAWVSYAEVRAVEGAACDRVRLDALGSVEGEIVAGFPMRGLRGGSLCGLHLVPTVFVDPPAGAPDAVLGHTLFVRGRRADGSPFELSSDALPGLDVVAMSPSDFDESRAFVLAFDAAAWFRGLDLGSAPLDPDGVARIGPVDPLTASFEAAFAGSLELYDDPNGDEHLDAAELAAGAFATSH